MGKIRRAFALHGRKWNISEKLRNEIIEALKETETNLTWLEEETGLWKGWTYDVEKKRYYFDDIGNESLMGLWESQWLDEEKEADPFEQKYGMLTEL